ncbi:MAG: ABC transporter substrate-binding protein [Ezakiella sp.]|nr:ABC transporter substrate-binding protein [Ezakiella sp.]MDD7471218.1 ABC transporter substrate-binding protein [Bacillota bacterium]MDY3923355.1 ABC transporter substrate-binding protein [Ezakiella sp.]
MNKKLSILLALVMSIVFVFTACSKKDDKPAETAPVTEENKETSEEKTEETEEKEEVKNFEGKTLNVVATSDSYVPLFDKFTEQTGAKVEFLSMSSGEVIARTKAEGKPMADLWFGGGLDAFMAARDDGLLENYTSEMTQKVPAEYKDANGAYIAKGITVVGFLVNDKMLAEKNLPVPKTWKDLADPQYEHMIIMSNPAISGTNYAALKGLLDIYGEEEGWDLFEKINNNIDFYSKRGKDPQEKTVQGEFAIGIIPADKKAFDAATDNELTVVYPEDGICWVPEGVAIFKGSENAEIAKAFIDFMLTEDAQKMIAEIDGKDSHQLIVPGIEGFDLGLPAENLAKEDLSTFGSDREKVLEKFTEISAGKTEDK